jgi:hypothetical protein
MTTTRCKVTCTAKTNYPEQGCQLSFLPVASGSPENCAFFRSTPSGTIELSIVNEAVAANFYVGHEYYLDFSAAAA